MKEIYLSRGLVTVVDDDDYAALSVHNWYADPDSKTNSFYASRWINENGCKRKVRMARVILGLRACDGLIADHTNGLTLDNRKANLRVATSVQNTQNRRHRKGSSIFTGVSWDASSGKWKAQIKPAGKKINLGRFNRETDAALAYDVAARASYGDFAFLNFPLLATKEPAKPQREKQPA